MDRSYRLLMGDSPQTPTAASRTLPSLPIREAGGTPNGRGSSVRAVARSLRSRQKPRDPADTQSAKTAPPGPTSVTHQYAVLCVAAGGVYIALNSYIGVAVGVLYRQNYTHAHNYYRTTTWDPNQTLDLRHEQLAATGGGTCASGIRVGSRFIASTCCALRSLRL